MGSIDSNKPANRWMGTLDLFCFMPVPKGSGRGSGGSKRGGGN